MGVEAGEGGADYIADVVKGGMEGGQVEGVEALDYGGGWGGVC